MQPGGSKAVALYVFFHSWYSVSVVTHSEMPPNLVEAAWSYCNFYFPVETPSRGFGFPLGEDFPGSEDQLKVQLFLPTCVTGSARALQD